MSMLPVADIFGELSYEGFFAWCCTHRPAKIDWLQDAVLRRVRFMASASVNDPSQFPRGGVCASFAFVRS